jgi:nucleoside phosphorylase
MSALEQNERQVHLKYLQEVVVEKHPATQTDYYKGTFQTKKGKVTIILAKTDQTNVNAGIETERAIGHFNPNYVFFSGVAGGLKDVKIGDIVIGQDVYGYERGKATTEKMNGEIISIYKARPKFGASSYALERAATNFAFSDEWVNHAIKLNNSKFGESVKVYTGTIAAGEKVDADDKSELHKFLQLHCSHALAVEMEGLGFLEACRAYPQIQTLLLRGISDEVKEKEGADNSGSQEYAAANVAAFLFDFINEQLAPVLLPVDRNENIVNILCKLYPEGVKDNRVWLRAGGDLSRIPLNTPGLTQWVDAIELIENGGTVITIDALMNLVRSDFPNAQFSY